MKVSELSGALLDYWVAKAEKLKTNVYLGSDHKAAMVMLAEEPWGNPTWSPSTNWMQGGPIIEREEMSVDFGEIVSPNEWRACMPDTSRAYGATLLEAAMRCFVASKFGETVPDSINKVR